MKTNEFGYIVGLDENEIFVFGSNLAGIHGGGAARLAFDKFRARWGKGIGLYGKSYAIPTKDRNIQTLSLDKIEPQVDKFIKFAKEHKELTFYVTEIGCGLAGLKIKEMAPMFLKHEIPDNVKLPESFLEFKKEKSN